MYELLYQFLVRHRHLSLPGLGEFLIESDPSRIDVTNHAVLPPTYRIAFEEGRFHYLKHLYEWLAASLHIGETEAVIQLNEFCHAIKKDINSGKKIQWKKVGTLRRGLGGNLEFEAEALPLTFQKPVYAERVVHEEDVHTMLVGENEKTSTEMREWLAPHEAGHRKWWIWPVILAALLLATLILYFANNGFRSQATGNINKVQPAENHVMEGTNQ